MAWVTPPRTPAPPGVRPGLVPRHPRRAVPDHRIPVCGLPADRRADRPAMRAGRRRAEQAGGRLDPPMVLILDEAANICRIADLPDLYSHLGSRGMIPVTILQSYEQGAASGASPGWPPCGARRPGSSSAPASTHPGSPVTSPSWSATTTCRSGPISVGDGRASEQISFQRRMILEAADIRGHRAGNRAAARHRHPARPARPAALARRPRRRADRRGHGCAPRPPSSAPPRPPPASPQQRPAAPAAAGHPTREAS